MKSSLRLVAASSLLAVVLSAAACRTTTILEQGGVDTGPRLAVEGFMSAVRSGSATAVAEHWGTADGPARGRFSQSEHDQRVFIMMRCLRNDSVAVRGEVPGTSGGKTLLVEIFRGREKRQTSFTTVRGPARWFVEQIDMDPVRDLCSMQ